MKLENLVKSPLINKIIFKIKKSDDEKLYSIFTKLTIDDLLSIDESFVD